MIEQLTDEERAVICGAESLETLGDAGAKALRLLDGHAAERAALVLEVEERRKVDLENCKRIDALVAQLEAARASKKALDGAIDADAKDMRALRATVEKLTSELDHERKLVAENYANYRAVAARAEELTRERDEARDRIDILSAHVERFESEVTRLTEALAAAERERHREHESALHAKDRAEAAESECAALRATLHLEQKMADELRAELDKAECYRVTAESRLAAANALLRRIDRRGGCGLDVHGWIADYFAAQPATAPARTDAEQRVLDACSVAFLVDGVHPRFAYDGCAETVARAELARRGLKP